MENPIEVGYFSNVISDSLSKPTNSLTFQYLIAAMAPPLAATPLGTPPEISAPKLVTSTNPATGSSLSPNKEVEDWHSKYLEAKFTCKKLRAQVREQAKKSRQLIVAVKTKLQDEEKEKLKVSR